MKQEKDILKWFNNELSNSEKKGLETTEEYEVLNKIAHYSSHLEPPKVDAQQAYNAFKKDNLNKKEVKVKRLDFKLFYKVAAVLAIMLTSSYFIFFNTEKTFSTTIAQTQNITLPDASLVTLNAKSSLSYNKKTWDKSRDLNLQGEAFFKVSKGERFTVKTTTGNVQVLGTEFNVRQRKNSFEVYCYEGKVSVTHNNQNIILTPGKGYKVNNGKTENIEFNSSTPTWLSAETTFNKTTLAQVIEELQRQYDITITTKNVDTSQLFSGSFTHNDKNIALKSITIPLSLSYTIKGKDVVLYKYEN